MIDITIDISIIYVDDIPVVISFSILYQMIDITIDDIPVVKPNSSLCFFAINQTIFIMIGD